MKLKKILAIGLSMAMTMGLLAGCAVSTDTGASAAATGTTTEAEAPAAATDTAASGDAEEITWMFWDDLNATEDLISLGYKDVIDRFNKDYEGVYHVTPITTNLEEYYPKLNALVASNQTPDVFIVSPGPNLDVYVNPGVVAPLNDYLADGWMDTFSSEAVLSGGKYGDNYYAVPLNIAAACVFYNTEMFEKAGAEVPTTWTEFLDTCKKLQDAGFTPITISAGTAWCLSMVAGYLCDRNGADLTKIANHEADWTDPVFVDAANQLVELSQYFQPTAASDTNDVATAAFYDEEAAILIQGSWAIGQINGANPDFESKCGVFQFPAIEGGNDPNRVIAKSDSLAMSATTEHPEAAVALMKYFTDDTAQKYTAEKGGKIPVTKVEYDAAAAPAELAYVMDIFGNASGTFGFYNESLASTEAGSTFDDAMVSIYLGQSTVEQGLQTIEDFYVDNVWE
ncbi:MAG: extracellular solute-binding protein [Lachnospiraceae bacterium]|nr:extracellular solute-binding protein [Lachnospiraceae bacterium]MBR2275680.1 extracellular solute-binding protein [Lachnospiraceae bacterium]